MLGRQEDLFRNLLPRKGQFTSPSTLGWFPASVCLKPVVYRLRPSWALGNGSNLRVPAQGGQRRSVPEGVRHQASSVLGDWSSGGSPLIPSWPVSGSQIPLDFPAVNSRR